MIINQKDDLADLWRKFYFNAYLKFVKLSAKFSRNTNQLFIHFLYSISKLRKLEEKYAQSHLSESYVFLKISLQRLKFLCNGIAYFTAFLKLKCGISYNASLQVQTLLHLNFLYTMLYTLSQPQVDHSINSTSTTTEFDIKMTQNAPPTTHRNSKILPRSDILTFVDHSKAQQ